MKNEDKVLNRNRLICKEKEGVEVNELFLNQYNVIKFSLLWKCEICIYAQWNIDEQWLCLLHLSLWKKIQAHYLPVPFLSKWLTLIHFSLHWSYWVYWIWCVLIKIVHILIQVILSPIHVSLIISLIHYLTNVNSIISWSWYLRIQIKSASK